MRSRRTTLSSVDHWGSTEALESLDALFAPREPRAGHHAVHEVHDEVGARERALGVEQREEVARAPLGDVGIGRAGAAREALDVMVGRERVGEGAADEARGPGDDDRRSGYSRLGGHCRVGCSRAGRAG